jgi:Tol biopolymer transport system component
MVSRSLLSSGSPNLPGPERHPDISPDGRQVLYSSRAAGNSDIYLLRVGGAGGPII